VRNAIGAGPEQSVDHYTSPRGTSSDAHVLQGLSALGEGVRCFRGNALHNLDFYPGVRHCSSHDPSIAAVVSGASEDHDTLYEAGSESVGDDSGRSAAGALHQGARRRSRGNRGPVTLRGFRRGHDAD